MPSAATGETPILILLAPTNVAATDSISGTSTVTWTKSTNATNYEIYVGTTDVFGSATLNQTVGDVATADVTGRTGLRYYYWVVATAAGFDDSSESASATAFGDAVLFYDTFDGTVIDTAKWVVQDVSANGSVTQNDEGIITLTGTTANNQTRLTMVDAYSATTMLFDIQVTNDLYAQTRVAAAFVDFAASLDNVGINTTKATSTGGIIVIGIRLNGVDTNNVTASLDITQKQTIKISNVGADVVWSYWDNGWITLYTASGKQITTATKFYFDYYSLGTAATGKADNVYMLSQDITTQYP